MFQNPTSTPGWSRRDTGSTYSHVAQEPGRGGLTVSPARVSKAPDRQLLVLLGAHQVLTTAQLRRLTGMPERTVQHRLGVLCRAGFVNRQRPRVAVGTAPYHCWLTAFGAAAVGVGPPAPWSEDPAGLQTTAGMSDLWLGLTNASSAGLTVHGWRRLCDGFTFRDGRTSAQRRIPADAELAVGLDGGGDVRALVFARLDRVPAARLTPVLARWADCLRPPPSASPQPPPSTSPAMAMLVLTGGQSRRAVVLDAARNVAVVADEVAVAAVGGNPAALATGAVWCRPTDGVERRVVDVLAAIAEGGR